MEDKGCCLGLDESRSTTLEKAARTMQAHRKSAIVILSDEPDHRVCGIFTERDALRSCVKTEAISLADGMTKDPKTIAVTKSVGMTSSTMDSALKMMAAKNFRHVPIVDEKGAFVEVLDIVLAVQGAVTKDSADGKRLTEALSRSAMKLLRFKSSLKRFASSGSKSGKFRSICAQVLTMRPDNSVLDAANEMLSRNKSAVLVVQEGSMEPIGIFTESDLVRRVLARGRSVHETTLGDVMTEKPYIVKHGMKPVHALTKMIRKGYRHLPVESEDGQVIEILDMLMLVQSNYRASSTSKLAPWGRVVHTKVQAKDVEAKEIDQVGEMGMQTEEGSCTEPALEKEKGKIIQSLEISETEREAITALMSGEFERAAKSFTIAIDAASDPRVIARLHCRKGATVSVLGKLDEAIHHAEQALVHARNAKDIPQGLVNEAHMLLFESLVETERYEKAYQLLSEIDTSKRRECELALENERVKLKDLGRDLFKSKDFSAAMVAYTNALRIPQGEPSMRAILYSNRGACYQHLGDLKYARQDCEKAVELNPTYVKAWSRLCGCTEGARAQIEVAQRAQKAVEEADKRVFADLIERFKQEKENRISQKVKQLGQLIERDNAN